jgi:hypothetical protein
MTALRSVVKHYPQQDLSTRIIEIQWPYPILVHHYDELIRLRDEHAEKSPDDLCVRERGLDKQLNLLINFLDNEIMDLVRAEKQRHKRVCFTSDFLWVAMRPGATLFYQARERQDNDDWHVGFIHSVSGGVFQRPPRDWRITHWSMEYDGKYLGRVAAVLNKIMFDGESNFKDHRFLLLGPGDFREPPEDGPLQQAIK